MCSSGDVYFSHDLLFLPDTGHITNGPGLNADGPGRDFKARAELCMGLHATASNANPT